MGIDVAAIRKDFPILHRRLRNDVPLVYLDSAATSQKPRSVLDAERDYYEHANSAVHRGAHQLADEATTAFEDARRRIAAFVGAGPQELVFTRNATEGLNLAAYAFSNATDKARMGTLPPEARRLVLAPGDSIVVTEMEHHANLVPWQEVCAKTGATLRWIRLREDGRLDLDDLQLIDETTKAVSVVHQSNLLGTVNPVEAIMDAAHAVGAVGIVDACQSVPQMPVDVKALGADLVAWSGHKMLGPTGIGCLYATTEMLEAMPPFLTGGSMIEMVAMERSTYAHGPRKFEAGVPMVAQAIGLAAAVEYLESIGMAAIAEHEHRLVAHLLQRLAEVPGVRILGPVEAVDRGSAVSFVVDGIHAHDVGQVLDSRGIAVRVGHHCAWPACRRLEVPAATRISPYLYNSESELDAAVDAVIEAQQFFGTR